MPVGVKMSDSEALKESLLFVDHAGEPCVSTPRQASLAARASNIGRGFGQGVPKIPRGPRQKKIFAQLVREAYAKYLVEAERSRRKALGEPHEAYHTTYENVHCVEDFVPRVELEMTDPNWTTALERAVRTEPAITVWSWKHHAGAPHGKPLIKVTPPVASQPDQPFRRTSLFTTPVHLSLHEPPQEQEAVRAARMRAGRPAPLSLKWREDRDPWGAPQRTGHFPLADTFSDVGKKYWCDR